MAASSSLQECRPNAFATCHSDRRCVPRLLVFADDWGRHPSSCQHLISQLLPSYEVAWVNSIGMRPPRVDWQTARRGIQKLGQWTTRNVSHNGAQPQAPTVLNPRMWPWFGSRFSRALNRSLLSRQLRRYLEMDGRETVAVTTVPIVADVMDDVPVKRWVYYCVDDFSLWPGLDQKTMQVMERRLIQRSDVLVAVSRSLQQKLHDYGRPNVEYLPHGIDLEHWRQTVRCGASPFPAALPRPLILFWGIVDRRMDPNFVRRLAADLSSGSVVFIGPSDDPDPELFDSQCVHYLGPQPYAQLPLWGRHADVLIMPYADLPVTRAMQPLKLLEYLAAEKPAVVRRLPSTAEWADCLDLAETPDEFSKVVRERLRSGVTESQRSARTRLTRETWASKAADFERMIFRSPIG